MSRYDLQYMIENFRVGFRESLGATWWEGMSDGVEIPEGVLFDGAIPVEVARKFFDWNPERVTLMRESSDGSGMPTPLKNWKGEAPAAYVRSDNGMLLGVNSDGYPETGYSERLLDGLEQILDDDLDLKIGSLIVLDGGSKASVQITMTDVLVHDATGEQFRTWLAAYSSLDGSTRTTFKKGATRIQCDNTFDMFVSESGEKYAYKNTQNSGLQVATARDALKIFEGIETDLWGELDRLVQAEVSEPKWNQLLDVVVPVPEKDGRGKTMAENKRLELADLYFNDPRVGFSGTAWGAFQAFSTHNQHETTVRDNDNLIQRNSRKLLTGQTMKFDQEVMTAIDQVVFATV